MSEKVIVVYKTPDGKEPFVEWLYSLRDKVIPHRIEARLEIRLRRKAI